MALNPAARYPGQLETGVPGYPYGKAQNVIGVGDGNGTPFERDLVNDVLGFQQALLVTAGITPSGTPESATSSQYLQAFYRLLGRADGWGALGDDSADDTTALQAGLNAVAARGAGRQAFHLVEGKVYRITGLSIPANVDLYCHGATLSNTSTTAAWLTYAAAGATASRQYQQLCDVTFTATVAATGAMVALTTNQSRVWIRNAWFGSNANCQGKFIDASTVGGTVKVSACKMQGRANVRQIHISTGSLVLKDVSFDVPATCSSNVVETSAAAVFADEVEFALGAHASGVVSCMAATGVGVRMQIGTMRVTGGLAGDSCISWSASCTIRETGLNSSGNPVWYSGSDTLVPGSRLSLRPNRASLYASNTLALPSGYESVSAICTVPGSFQLQFPAGLFVGQPLRLTARTEDSGSTFAPTIGGAVDVDADSGGVLVIGSTVALTGQFQWLDPTGGTSYRWVQIGKWGTASI